MPSYVPVALVKEFNHKGILEEDSEARFTGLADQGVGRRGHFFKASGCPQSNTVIEVEGIPFNFPDKDMMKYDNIKCSGQKLRPPIGYYSRLHIISFNDVTQSEDLAELLFEDGTVEKVTLSSLPWGKAGKSEKNDNNFSFVKEFFLAGKSVLQCKNTLQVDVGCTLCSVEIVNQDKKLSAVLLPENPMLHIFSITLECL